MTTETVKVLNAFRNELFRVIERWQTAYKVSDEDVKTVLNQVVTYL